MMGAARALQGFALFAACFAAQAAQLRNATQVQQINPVRLMMFKVGRSGSTWVASEMNMRPGVFLREELITGSSGKAYPMYLKEDLVHQSLLRPVNNIVHTMRCQTCGLDPLDGLDAGTRRCIDTHHGDAGQRGCLNLLGFTMNPRSSMDMDYAKIAQGVPNTHALFYVRTNVVKHVIGLIHGNMLWKTCHKHNVPHGDACASRVPEQFSVEPSSFVKRLLTKVQDWDRFKTQAARLEAGGVKVHWITYEACQIDVDAEIDRVFTETGVHNSRERTPREIFSKYTKEDAREVLLNYAAVEAELRRTAPCLLPMLQAKQATVFDYPACTGGLLETTLMKNTSTSFEKNVTFDLDGWDF